ncbi:MAG: SH3 domain-containing protein [Deltaproteobacteria bacterium]|nr:SH3 domain-containing protein [Deltaproteobacteria bacterium]
MSMHPIVRSAWPLLALGIAFPARAADGPARHYRTGERLYVHANPGLSLRKEPGTEAQKVGMLTYRQAVYVLPDKRAPVPFRFENIPGHWVLVERDGEQGYAFDGYLSRYPVPEEKEGLKDWADRTFGKPISDETSKQMTDMGPGSVRVVRYHGGAQYRSMDAEVVSSDSLVLPSGRLVDGFLVGRGFHVLDCMTVGDLLPVKTGKSGSGEKMKDNIVEDKGILVACANGFGTNLFIELLEDGSIRITWGSHV